MENNNNVLHSIQSKMAEIEVLREQAVKELQVSLFELFRPIFEKYDFINELSWVQYTPYFNDGDECIFSVSFDNIIYSRDIEEYLSEYVYHDDRKSNEKYNSELALDIDSLIASLGSIDDDFYKSLFGDHVEVTVQKDGKIDVKEYYHD